MNKKRFDDSERTQIISARQRDGAKQNRFILAEGVETPTAPAAPVFDERTQVISPGRVPRDAKFDPGVSEANTEGERLTRERDGEVVGWLVVVKGPGRGKCREIYNGINTVGRGDSQRISLNFGDETISREEHAYLAFDDETNQFYFQHAGRANIVRVNDEPVLANVTLKDRDRIRIGKSHLMFVPLCDDKFNWTTADADQKIEE